MARSRKNTLRARHENAMIRLEIAQFRQSAAMLEALPSFAEDPDEKDWTILTGATGKKPYTEVQLQALRLSAQKLQYTCSGRGILQTLRDFIIGRHASIDPVCPDEKVQEYWDEWQDANNFDQRSKEMIHRTFRDGEIFIRWFLPASEEDHLRIRLVNPNEIMDPNKGKPEQSFGIETDVDDVENIRAYHRKYKRGNSPAYEVIEAAFMDHVKIMVDSDVKRGVSFFVGIAKWMRQYELWLRDRYMLNRIRQIWNVVGKVQPGTAVSTIKEKFTDVSRNAAVGGEANKRQPKPGSILIDKNIEWDLKNLNIRAQDTKDDGRQFQLLIGVGTGFPEYIIRCDASNSNYASTMVAESPFVRAMESWQDVWEFVFKNIFKRVITHGIAIARIPKTIKDQVQEFNEQTGKDETKTKEIPTSTDCTVNFATLIHRDIDKETKAFQIHKQERWASDKTLSEKCGYDPDYENEQIRREEEAEAEREKKRDDVDQQRLRDRKFDKDAENEDEDET